MDPVEGFPHDNGLELLLGVDVDRTDGVIGSSLQDDDDDDDEGKGPLPLPLFVRKDWFKCRVIISSSPSMPNKRSNI